MKKVPLETKQIEIPGQGNAELVYSEHYLNMLRQPKSQGPMGGTVTATEMRLVLPIMDKIEAAVANGKGFVLLEDSEHAELSERAESFPFTVAHKELNAMIDAVVNAESVDIQEVEAG